MKHAAADWQAENASFLERLVAALRERLAGLAAHSAARPAPLPFLPADGPKPALLVLQDAFGLSRFETTALALCAAHELDTGIGPLCAAVNGDALRPWPSFGLALQAFPPGEWEAVSATGPLRYWHLLAVERRFGEPLTMAPLRCEERILDFVKGLNRLDERLDMLATEIRRADSEPADPQGVARLTHLWGEGPAAGPVVLFGADAELRRALVVDAATACRRRLFEVEADVLPNSTDELESFARQWNREAALLPIALLIEASSVGDGPNSAPLRRFIRKLSFPAACGAQVPPRWSEGLATVSVTRPGPPLQEAAWLANLGTAKAPLARRLACAFDFSTSRIASLAARADAARLWQDCVASVRPRLDTLAQRIEPRAGWGDLMLPADQQAALRQIIDQMWQRRRVHDEWGYAARMNRGLGITALFAGESGTGKTMAAEVLAAELQLNLYRIDLSVVVSKYIGETERNLRQLFDAAEQGGVVLLFDEADALFGKRSEVKDSHDRYANIEVNYLLQRVESFSGLAILATNLKAALDSAFLRRMRFVVRFPHPGPAERQAMWRRVFPATVPIVPLDYERLGRINLTGGHIATAAVNAAFLAAAADEPVEMGHVLQAARAELVKLSRPIAEAEFVPAALTARAAE